MKHRFRNGSVYVALYLLLILASVDTAAHFVLLHLSNLGSTSTALVSELRAQEKSILPVAIDQFVKNADAKTKRNIIENRAKINAAVSDLLNNPEFESKLAEVARPIGQALTAGEPSVAVETKSLAGLVATEINTIAGKKVISPTDIAKMSKPQTIDLTKPAKVVHAVDSISTGLLWLWIPILLLAALVIRIRRQQAFATFSKIFLSLALPILGLWLAIPPVVNGVLKSKADSELATKLFPIVYGEVTGFTEVLGFIYLAVGVVALVITRIIRKRASSTTFAETPAIGS